MRWSTLLLVASCCVACPAQVTDVGLTLGLNAGGISGGLFGQACGLVTCGPLPGGTMAAGSSAAVAHHGAPNSPFALVIGLPGPCFQFPGIANDVMLSLPPVTLAVGATSAAPSTSLCQQGQARFVLQLPPTAPSGVVFRLQSLGVSNSGALAFSPAIEVTVR
jgi:hypothetical protein